MIWCGFCVLDGYGMLLIIWVLWCKKAKAVVVPISYMRRNISFWNCNSWSWNLSSKVSSDSIFEILVEKTFSDLENSSFHLIPFLTNFDPVIYVLPIKGHLLVTKGVSFVGVGRNIYVCFSLPEIMCQTVCLRTRFLLLELPSRILDSFVFSGKSYLQMYWKIWFSTFQNLHIVFSSG